MYGVFSHKYYHFSLFFFAKLTVELLLFYLLFLVLCYIKSWSLNLWNISYQILQLLIDFAQIYC